MSCNTYTGLLTQFLDGIIKEAIPFSEFLSYIVLHSHIYFMGCANSKQKRCHKCNSSYSPLPRSNSMHAPPQTDEDFVALTSTTLGTQKLNFPCDHDDSSDSFKFINGNFIQHQEENKSEKKEEFSIGLIEAKTWSKMIEQKLPKVAPKTPTRTPPGEPETIINTWELMEGLEDTTPFRSPNRFRSFSFDSNAVADSPKSMMWLQMTQEQVLNPAISDFDPQVLSSIHNSFHLQPSEAVAVPTDVVRDVKLNQFGKEKVVLYFTSLRGVRKTYEDCCKVSIILKGLGVRVDERDVSMHSRFKEELKEMLGDGYVGGGLPRVFVGKDYIGGAEEIQKLHEDGKLEKLFLCCDKIEDTGNGVCEACGDIRFVACEICKGSCKIYHEGDDDQEDGETGQYGFHRCPDCNENGLIRCPMCCY